MKTRVGTIDPLIETRLAQFLEPDLIKNPKRMRPSPINSMLLLKLDMALFKTVDSPRILYNRLAFSDIINTIQEEFSLNEFRKILLAGSKGMGKSAFGLAF